MGRSAGPTLTQLDRALQYQHEDAGYRDAGGGWSMRITTQRRGLSMWSGAILTALVSLLFGGVTAGGADTVDQAIYTQVERHKVAPSGEPTHWVHMPAIFSSHGACDPIPGASYGTLSVESDPTDRPAEEHPDLNLAIRGYEPTSAFLGLVDYDGGIDPGAPQLSGLFADHRIPAFSSAHQVHRWDWDCDCLGSVYETPEVTLLGMATGQNELVHVPQSGYDIGSGYQVLVLYAAVNRITLKYTREDNVVEGYTLHVENICTDPTLLALYRQWDEAGRSRLPALRAGQAFGYATLSEIGVVIRDTGAFLDPRSRKDWWQ